jgi:formylglycine-generating enzyme required for sulfatase activity
VFSDHATVWLRVWFSQEAAGPCQLLAPDQRIAAVGYALAAATALSVEEPVTPVANMVWIGPGSFAMGSPEDELDRNANEGPQTSVTIRRGFWMGIHEVTQGQYESVMGNNPSWFNGDRTSEGGEDYGEDARRPVDRVSWHDAVAYCAAVTTQARNAGHVPSDWAYRLPTEAEWEYAARAGTATRYSHGDDLTYKETPQYAWCSANSDYQTHPVGQKRPNPWGLYDMYGNLAEWCADWYAWNYPGGSLIDPTGPATGNFRVTRGAYWDNSAKRCRSARRVIFLPEDRNPLVGFRVVLAPGLP